MMARIDLATEAEGCAYSVRTLSALLLCVAEGLERDTNEQKAVEAAREYAETIGDRMGVLTAKLYDAVREGGAR